MKKKKNYIATRVLWGNSTEVKTTEYFGTNKEIKEIIGEAMEFEEFKRYYNLLKRLSNEEVTFLQKAAKLMNEIAPVAKLNVNYFYKKTSKIWVIMKNYIIQYFSQKKVEQEY